MNKNPSVYMTRNTIKMLRYIRWHKNAIEQDIRKHFGDDFCNSVLINLCLTDYLIAIKPDGTYTNFKDGKCTTAYNYKYWVTPKGQEFLDNRFDRLWQWAIPTLISVAALIASLLC